MSDEKKTEFDFKLDHEIPYAFQGETVKSDLVKLYAPSSKQLKFCTELKQAFMRSMPEGNAKYTKDEIDAMKELVKESGKEMTGSDVISTMYMSPKVDMVHVLLSAIELFRSGVAKIGGEIKLNKLLIDEMSQEDLESMTGEYLVNFILRSVLKEMM